MRVSNYERGFMLTLLMLILEGLEEADKNNDAETEKS
tara:strand:+ start:496 stop:606 length:111 start_codon:yes stop_codon:yes gene_type:complete